MASGFGVDSMKDVQRINCKWTHKAAVEGHDLGPSKMAARPKVDVIKNKLIVEVPSPHPPTRHLGCVEGFNLSFRAIAGYPRWPAIALKLRLKPQIVYVKTFYTTEGSGRGVGGRNRHSNFIFCDVNAAAGGHLGWTQVVSFYWLHYNVDQRVEYLQVKDRNWRQARRTRM